MSNSIGLDEIERGDPTPADIQAKIDVVERKQDQVESALNGFGSYLGTRDHVSMAPPE